MRINSQWFQEQTAAQGISLRTLAKRLKMDAGALSNTFNGKRRMTLADATKIAKAFSQPLETVLGHAGIPMEGLAPTTASVPVRGFVDGVLGVTWEKPKGPSHVPFPVVGGAAKGIVALRAQTTGSLLEPLDGALFFLKSPLGGKPSGGGSAESKKAGDSVGKLCVVQVLADKTNGESWHLATIKRGYAPGRYSLFSLAGLAMKEDVQVGSVTPLIWMKLP